MRALLSVSDKSGLAAFAKGLQRQNVELIASGGTARALQQAGLPVVPVEQITGFPEMLGGRVKTLHPAVHAGILAADTAEHRQELANHSLTPIDIVAVNLYPFRETVARPGVALTEAIEQIDIGGVALLRAAAKNHARVYVICDPADYDAVLAALPDSQSSEAVALRRRLACKAFQHTAAYDAAIGAYLDQLLTAEEEIPTPTEKEAWPAQLSLELERVQLLRYGENPHQAAALYRIASAPPAFEQLQGKELSYNNLLDLDAAWALVQEFTRPGVTIIKHNNPCGAAEADSLAEAYRHALACDPVSAFGSVIAVNRPLDAATVAEIDTLFVEVLTAPAIEPDAQAALARKQNLRLMRATGAPDGGQRLHSIYGGVLAQQVDDALEEPEVWRVVTERQPSEDQRRALAFAWRVVKYVRSNAIVLAAGAGGAFYTVGVGAGQMSRVDAVEIAARKAGARAQGSVLASDAFFPFPDGVEKAAAAGVRAVVQPGGSVRDAEVIAACNRLGVAMCFTGVRHFRH